MTIESKLLSTFVFPFIRYPTPIFLPFSFSPSFYRSIPSSSLGPNDGHLIHPIIRPRGSSKFTKYRETGDGRETFSSGERIKFISKGEEEGLPLLFSFIRREEILRGEKLRGGLIFFFLI